MLPTATDLDDPDGFVHRGGEEPVEGGLDFDAIDKLLGEAAAKNDEQNDEKDDPKA